MTSLIEILKEQSSFGFTGKINVLGRENNQFLGVVYQQEGAVVGGELGDLRGKKALLKMIFDDVEKSEMFKFVVEPELVSLDVITFKLSFEEIKKEAQAHFKNYISAKKLRPADHLKLIIDPEIIVSKEELSPLEFDLLLIISEWCKVGDIYNHSRLMDFDITHALVSLRKKKAIKVFQN